MKKLFVLLAALGVGAAASSSIALAVPPTGVTATPPSTKTWQTTYSATFQRSASGIINETNRVNSGGAQNGWTSADVWIQFRPIPGTPANPNCDPAGLVTQLTYNATVSGDTSLIGDSTSGYFLPNKDYNACVYLVNPQIGSGIVNSANEVGTDANLAGLTGRFRIDVNGTWLNTPHGLVDAEYTNGDNGNVWPDASFTQDGFPGLGADFGDLLVNNAAVNWGAFNLAHSYSYTTASTSAINLRVFDGDASGGSLVDNPSWYSDNNGSLNYTITYLGQ
jgi:hypothetical protein